MESPKKPIESGHFTCRGRIHLATLLQVLGENLEQGPADGYGMYLPKGALFQDPSTQNLMSISGKVTFFAKSVQNVGRSWLGRPLHWPASCLREDGTVCFGRLRPDRSLQTGRSQWAYRGVGCDGR